MTVLQALDRYYERMAERGEAESPGYSREKIGFAIVLSPDGEPVDVIDLRDHSDRKPQPAQIEVPAAVKRTAGILPNLFWDKTSYALGRTAAEGRRTAEEHAAFRSLHLDSLQGIDDPGLLALTRFLESWEPERFDAAPFTSEMLDANIVFRLEGEHQFIHQREAAKSIIQARSGGEAAKAFCLITGASAPIRRLHPTIKGVEGAQSSGAALVSFNLDAFTSYGKDQGANAPTSEAAAFRYGAALNRMLDRNSRNRMTRPVGDATVVFWADTSRLEEAEAAEQLFGFMFDPPNDESERAKVGDALEKLMAGRPVASLAPDLNEKTTFHVLGLSPNAARLSVRFWLSDTFGAFARRLAEHYADLQIEPLPRPWKPPAVSFLLAKTTALQENFSAIPHLLAGEMTRAILTGTRYPRTLLTAVVTRLRAGDDPSTGWHAAAIRAVLARESRLGSQHRPDFDPTKEPPMSLDRASTNAAYNLGRLFAALETAQRLALGKVNATIRDRYFGAASATPARVFPLLMRGVQSHVGKLRKEGKGGWIEREIEEIFDRLPPELPRSLRLENQGRFAIGYYHQRKAQFAGRTEAEIESGEGDDGDE